MPSFITSMIGECLDTYRSVTTIQLVSVLVGYVLLKVVVGMT